MIHQLGEYVVSLTAAAMISGILVSLLPEGNLRQVMRTACGVFLAVTALSPLGQAALPDLEGLVRDPLEAGQAAAAQGEAMADTERISLIKLGLEAYLLDKAAAMGVEVTARVRLDPQGNPTGITVSGDVPDAQRRRLEAVIAEDLGIPKEAQQWTG